MPNSVLDAIKMGIWDFEPADQREQQYEATAAMPGSTEKISVLSRRLERGEPLWHPHDRVSYEPE